MSTPRTLAVDIGGTGLKMVVLDTEGGTLTEPTRVLTPKPSTPEAVISALDAMSAQHGQYDRISVGFPGVVVEGVTLNAPNLGTEHWAGCRLAERLSAALEAPTRVANDADVQGFGAIEGRGVELVITLGTGVGSALFVDGVLVPNLEMGHHPGPFDDGSTYEAKLGMAALNDVGEAVWNTRLQRALKQLEKLFNYRTLFLGGGHANIITFELPEHVQRVDNIAGLLGGIRLWDGSRS